MWPFSKKKAAPAYSSNTWLGQHTDNTAIVFVHGVLSDPGACWFNSKSGSYWPKMVAEDTPTFGGAGVYLGGYHTGFTSGTYGIRDCAQELFTGLSLPVGVYPPVMEHERIVFVCHSLGGIVVRYMLEAWREAFPSRQPILLVLVASPSLGSKYAIWLESVIQLFGNRQGKQLGWRSEMLEDLDRRFKDLCSKQLIPGLNGCEFIEQHFPLPIGFAPIVSELSAARYFGDFQMVPDSNHMSVVKPPDRKAFVHQLLQGHYREFDKKCPSFTPLQKRPDTNGLAVIQPVFECGRLHWSIRINSHGDGHNETSFENITAVKNGDLSFYQLGATSVDRGYLSRYVKDSARTSPEIDLMQQIKPSEVTAKVSFRQSPSRELPQKLLLEMLAFHAYALERGDRADELDYAERSIGFERFDDFLFEVSFPDTMALSTAECPFVLAYQNFPGRAQMVLDAALTRQAVEGFRFSPLARTAYLRVSKPPPHSTFRIYWRLGDQGEELPRPSDRQIALAEARRAVLLGIRELIGSAAAADENSRQGQVLSTLAEFGKFIVRLLRTVLGAPDVASVLDALEQELEINVMVVEMARESNECVLKFVAGTGIGNFWNTPLKLGEGIAGRAASWLQAQYYDDERARNTVSWDSYMELAPDRRHAWLLAIPLWVPADGPAPVGVLNIATFNSRFARILRALNQTELINTIEKEALEKLLPAILRA